MRDTQLLTSVNGPTKLGLKGSDNSLSGSVNVDFADRPSKTEQAGCHACGANALASLCFFLTFGSYGSSPQ